MASANFAKAYCVKNMFFICGIGSLYEELTHLGGATTSVCFSTGGWAKETTLERAAF